MRRMALCVSRLFARSGLHGRLWFWAIVKVSHVTPTEDHNTPSSFSGTARTPGTADTAGTTGNLGIRRYGMSGLLPRNSMKCG